MSDLSSLGLNPPPPQREDTQPIEQVIVQKSLDRVLAFTGKTLDDVINDPISRNLVHAYYRLYKQVHRACEVVDLERWWNGAGI
jgi:hypothetical protein